MPPALTDDELEIVAQHRAALAEIMSARAKRANDCRCPGGNCQCRDSGEPCECVGAAAQSSK